jgi:hypothetical protein
MVNVYLQDVFRFEKQPWTPESKVKTELKVDFVKQTSISDSKCYTDLETTGSVECKWLTLFLSQLSL